MNSKYNKSTFEMINFILGSVGLSSISVLFGSLLFTILDIFYQVERWGADFVRSTLKYNVSTFIECMFYIFPVSVISAIVAYWFWKARNVLDKNKIHKISLLLGGLGGLGNLLVISILDNQLGKTFLGLFEMLVILTIWILSSSFWGWTFGKFFSERY